MAAMKDRNGLELEFGDIVVVERGVSKGLVGSIEGWHGPRQAVVAPDLWAPMATARTVALGDLRLANDIERARWKRDAKARAEYDRELWLETKGLPDHLKGD